MIDTYAVMGNPVAHSKSPLIHMEFAKQTHQLIRYLKIKVPFDKLEERINLFLEEKGRGLNMSMPFKLQAFQLATETSERATIAKAVNTIKFLEEDKIYGDNTDGVGLIRDLRQNLDFDLADKSILILGAGGAVRGVLHPLLMERPKKVVLANRTLIKAEMLAEEFKQYGSIQAFGLDRIPGDYDLIINGTSIGLNEKDIYVTPTVISKNTFCYDMVYGQKLTPFLKWAVSNGASRAVDGIGMLVEQAAEAFYLWRGVKPETKKIIAMLKKS